MSEPLPGVLLNEGRGPGDPIRVVGFEEPFDLCELALIEELVGQVLGFDLVVKLGVVLRRDEVEEELANLLVNRMVFQQFQIGHVHT